MARSKKEIVYLVIRGILSVLTVAVCITLLAQVVSIYFEGISEGHEGDIFSRELLGGRLMQFLWLYVLWFVFIITEYITYYALKIERKKHKPVFYEEDTLRRLQRNLSEDGLKEVELIPQAKPWVQAKIAVYIICGVAVASCAMVCLAYVFDPSNFPAQNLMGDVATMMLNLLPFILTAFAFTITARYLISYFSTRELFYVRTVYSVTKARKSHEERQAKKVAKQKKRNVIVWAVRGVLLVVGVVFVFMGIFNGGMQDVLMKAIKICTECIGLG